MWWGFTPALNICAEIDKPDINVLCIGQSDCRHVIQTLSKKFEHSKCKIKVYLYEPCIENIARSLLLLSIALDEKIGVGQRASRFLEIYGNSLLRPSTSEYLSETAQRLIKVVTNFSFGEKVFPFVSLDGLKYKERDKLEHIFKFWSLGLDSFDILTYWDHRVRSSLGTRYDSRLGVYDWDLHMRYRPYGADIITIQEYKQFREKGMAFFQEDSDPCVPNVTFATFPLKGTSPMSGYFGDIVTGPYAAYSLQSDDKNLFKKINGLYQKSASDICLWNMNKILYEIENKAKFISIIGDSPDLPAIKVDTSSNLKQRKINLLKSFDANCFSSCTVSDVQICFMSVSSLNDFSKKPQFQNFFDLVTIPQNMVSQIPLELSNICKDNCIFVVESLKYSLNLNRDALAKAKASTDETIRNMGGESISSNFDFKKDDCIRYVIHK